MITEARLKEIEEEKKSCDDWGVGFGYLMEDAIEELIAEVRRLRNELDNVRRIKSFTFEAE